MSESRDRAAFISAVPVAAATVPVTVVGYVASVEGLPNGVYFGGAVIYFVVSALVTALAGAVVGLPIVWALRRAALMNFPLLLLAGFLSGGSVSWLILPFGESPGVFRFLIGAIAGSAAATTWWLIAEREVAWDA